MRSFLYLVLGADHLLIKKSPEPVSLTHVWALHPESSLLCSHCHFDRNEFQVGGFHQCQGTQGCALDKPSGWKIHSLTLIFLWSYLTRGESFPSLGGNTFSKMERGKQSRSLGLDEWVPRKGDRSLSQGSWLLLGWQWDPNWPSSPDSALRQGHRWKVSRLQSQPD